MPVAAGNPRVQPGTLLWLGGEKRVCTGVVFDTDTASYGVVTDDGSVWWLPPRKLAAAYKEAEDRFQNQLSVLNPKRVTAFQWILMTQKLVDLCVVHAPTRGRTWCPSTNDVDAGEIINAFRGPLGASMHDVMPAVLLGYVRRLPDFNGPHEIGELAEQAWTHVMRQTRMENRDG